MEDIQEMFASIGRMRKRQFILSVLSFGMIIASALALWKTLMILSGSESPIVVVLSGSMEPGFARGDLLFLVKDANCTLQVGDVVVYNVDGRQIPIVHRILKIHDNSEVDGNASPTSAKFLTKGDNNRVDDRSLYKRGDKWLSKSQIIGKAVASMPYCGMLTIWMNDYPWLKWVLVGGLAFVVLVNRE